MAFELEGSFESSLEAQLSFDIGDATFSIHDADEDLYPESYRSLPPQRCVVCFRTFKVPFESGLCSLLCKVNKTERQKRLTSIQNNFKTSQSYHSKALPTFCSTLERFDHNDDQSGRPASFDRSRRVSLEHQTKVFTDLNEFGPIQNPNLTEHKTESQPSSQHNNKTDLSPVVPFDELDALFTPMSRPIKVENSFLQRNFVYEKDMYQYEELDERIEYENDEEEVEEEEEFQGLVSTYTNMFPHSLPKEEENFFRKYLQNKDNFRRSQKLNSTEEINYKNNNNTENIDCENTEDCEDNKNNNNNNKLNTTRKSHAKSSVTAFSQHR